MCRVRCFGHVTHPCGNVQTQCDRVMGCYTVRKVCAYVLTICFPRLRSNTFNNIFNYLLSELYFALFVATLFDFALTFNPFQLSAYIICPFIFNYKILGTVSASIRSFLSPGTFDSDLQRFCVHFRHPFFLDLSTLHGLFTRTLRSRSFF